MKIILLGPIAAWQLYAAGTIFSIAFIVAAVYGFLYVQKRKRKK